MAFAHLKRFCNVEAGGARMRIYSLLLLLMLFQLLFPPNVFAQEDAFSAWYKEFYEAADKAKDEGKAESDAAWKGIAGKCKITKDMGKDEFAKGMGFMATKAQA